VNGFGSQELIVFIGVFTAFFIKGFSGFGTALLLVPLFTMLFGPKSALPTTALFDMIAGFILIISVRNKIEWPFVIKTTAALFVGAFIGVLFLSVIPHYILSKIIGFGLLVFIVVLLLQKNNGLSVKEYSTSYWHYFIAALSGFSGGLIGVSGPILAVYMKVRHKKDFFRTQLIAVFFFGSMWRLLLFYWHGMHIAFGVSQSAVLVVILLAGLWVGQHINLRVNETIFNRVIAVILLIPTAKLLFF
jgi:uncharacterized membrane protein YfcA